MYTKRGSRDTCTGQIGSQCLLWGEIQLAWSVRQPCYPPKFGPPPFRARKRSGFSSTFAWTTLELARTTCASNKNKVLKVKRSPVDIEALPQNSSRCRTPYPNDLRNETFLLRITCQLVTAHISGAISFPGQRNGDRKSVV